MRLIVISPEAEDTREPIVLAQLFAAGLTSYHLRKPAWDRDQLTAWLRAVPPEFHPRIVLHAHHELATEFSLGGLHDRDSEVRAGPLSPPRSTSESPAANSGPNSPSLPASLRSRAVHDLPTLRASLEAYDRLLVSPIFPSYSKPGYAPVARLAPDELKTVLALPRRAETIALGGIDASRISACHELGFDGVAVLGAIWQSDEPLRAFRELQRALLVHAA